MAFLTQGEVTSFDSYHKRSKISYDDGEEMWVALQRETFTWITPRAFGAGAENFWCLPLAEVPGAGITGCPGPTTLSWLLVGKGDESCVQQTEIILWRSPIRKSNCVLHRKRLTLICLVVQAQMRLCWALCALWGPRTPSPSPSS